MADRIPSDHRSITTVRASIVRRGATNRPAIELPDDAADSFPAGDVVRIVLDGDEQHGRIEDRMGDLVIPGVYDAPEFARQPGEASNRLVEWHDQTNLSFGQSVKIDVIEQGFKYGVRKPGDRTVYDATESPDDSLASIAEQTEGSR